MSARKTELLRTKHDAELKNLVAKRKGVILLVHSTQRPSIGESIHKKSGWLFGDGYRPLGMAEEIGTP